MDNKLMTILQLSDSAFPTGGFSHSSGLECATKFKLIKIAEDLEEFLLCTLENAGSFGLPFVKTAHENCTDVKKLCYIDQLCDASTSNHVAKRASVRQGKSLLDTCCKTFKQSSLAELLSSLPLCHQSVVTGSVCGVLDIDMSSTCTMFLCNTLKTAVASSVRLDIVGPIQAQEIQFRTQQSKIPDIIRRNEGRTVDDAAVTFPHVDIIQNCHDTMYSKLFYS